MRLLGSYIRDGTDGHVGLREAIRVVGFSGDTEIGEQYASPGTSRRDGDQDVRRFDVAVQQVAFMRDVERFGDCRDDLHHIPQGHPRWVLLDQVLGVGALDVVHRDPQPAVELAPVVHADDVRMPQRCGQLRLAVEPGAELLIARGAHREDLECIQTGKARMLGQVDLAHATGAQEPLNGVPGKDVTGI